MNDELERLWNAVCVRLNLPEHTVAFTHNDVLAAEQRWYQMVRWRALEEARSSPSLFVTRTPVILDSPRKPTGLPVLVYGPNLSNFVYNSRIGCCFQQLITY